MAFAISRAFKQTRRSVIEFEKATPPWVGSIDLHGSEISRVCLCRGISRIWSSNSDISRVCSHLHPKVQPRMCHVPSSSTGGPRPAQRLPCHTTHQNQSTQVQVLRATRPDPRVSPVVRNQSFTHAPSGLALGAGAVNGRNGRTCHKISRISRI